MVKAQPPLQERPKCASFSGFGFSDKPQPGPSFSYGLSEYQKALGSFLDALELDTFSIVAQVRRHSVKSGRASYRVKLVPALETEHAVTARRCVMSSRLVFRSISQLGLCSSAISM